MDGAGRVGFRQAKLPRKKQTAATGPSVLAAPRASHWRPGEGERWLCRPSSFLFACRGSMAALEAWEGGTDSRCACSSPVLVRPLRECGRESRGTIRCVCRYQRRDEVIDSGCRSHCSPSGVGSMRCDNAGLNLHERETTGPSLLYSAPEGQTTDNRQFCCLPAYARVTWRCGDCSQVGCSHISAWTMGMR